MPDIELFGQINEPDVRFVLRDAPYLGSLTFIKHGYSTVRNSANQPVRFLRVSWTNQFTVMNRKDLLKRLQLVGCGIETFTMEAWYEPE
jgi:hypothetical protein